MKKNYLIAIGLVVFIAFALVVRGLVFLHPKPGDGGTKLHVRFQNIDKIAKGTKVTFAGKPVGEVEKVLVVEDAFRKRPQSGQSVYPYELVLSIDSSVHVYETDLITTKTSGLLGERYIAIVPQPGAATGLIPVEPNQVIYAYESADVEAALKDMSGITKKAELTLDSVTTLIHDNQKAIQGTTVALENASKGLCEFLDSVNREAIVTEVSGAAKEARKLLTQVNSGSGTVGKLFYNPRLYDEASLCLQKTDFLMQSLSSYGLFFHTNPNWQRGRLLTEEKDKQQDGDRNAEINALLQDMNTLLDSLEQETEKTSSKENHPLVQNIREKISRLRQRDGFQN